MVPPLSTCSYLSGFMVWGAGFDLWEVAPFRTFASGRRTGGTSRHTATRLHVQLETLLATDGMPHTRQSRPHSGLGFQVQVLKAILAAFMSSTSAIHVQHIGNRGSLRVSWPWRTPRAIADFKELSSITHKGISHSPYSRQYRTDIGGFLRPENSFVARCMGTTTDSRGVSPKVETIPVEKEHCHSVWVLFDHHFQTITQYQAPPEYNWSRRDNKNYLPLCNGVSALNLFYSDRAGYNSVKFGVKKTSRQNGANKLSCVVENTEENQQKPHVDIGVDSRTFCVKLWSSIFSTKVDASGVSMLSPGDAFLSLPPARPSAGATVTREVTRTPKPDGRC